MERFSALLCLLRPPLEILVIRPLHLQKFLSPHSRYRVREPRHAINICPSHHGDEGGARDRIRACGRQRPARPQLLLLRGSKLLFEMRWLCPLRKLPWAAGTYALVLVVRLLRGLCRGLFRIPRLLRLDG